MKTKTKIGIIGGVAAIIAGAIFGIKKIREE